MITAFSSGLLATDACPYDRGPIPAHPAIRTVRVADTADTDNQPDWAACVARVAEQRCRDSFMQLFDHYAPRLNSYLRQQGASAELAEELAQEALLSLWRKAALYNPEKAQVSTWLFRIARNLMIDQLRRERGIAYDTAEAADEPVMEDEAPDATDAETLRRKIATLPQEQLTLVYKNFFEGKSHAEIATETGQPLGSVKSRLRAALQRLRGQLEAEVH